MQRFFPPMAPQLSLAGTSFEYVTESPWERRPPDPTPDDAVWFAVPKSKVSRGKKRMKTTKQKRIKMKENIVIDHRTGELTLRHKLPFNWRNYLPVYAKHAPEP